VSYFRSLTLAAGLIAAAAAPAFAAPDLRGALSPIRSFRGTVTVTQSNMDELAKIRKDFAQSYRVKSSQVFYQNPDRVKIQGNVGPMSVIYLIVGNTKRIKYGPLRREKNLVNDPGQKQSMLDFGMFTPDLLNDFNWKFVRQDGGLQVYELRFKNYSQDPTRRLIWVDPARKVVLRRQVFTRGRDNDLKMEVRHEGLRQVRPGVWVPTVVKVYNDQGRLGATSQLTNIAVNQTLPANTFKI
jgi:outer membrane lipoprotein-sorting protein